MRDWCASKCAFLSFRTPRAARAPPAFALFLRELVHTALCTHPHCVVHAPTLFLCALVR